MRSASTHARAWAQSFASSQATVALWGVSKPKECKFSCPTLSPKYCVSEIQVHELANGALGLCMPVTAVMNPLVKSRKLLQAIWDVCVHVLLHRTLHEGVTGRTSERHHLHNKVSQVINGLE